MKNTIILVVDILLRIAFTILGVYLLTKYSSDSIVKFTGFSIILFNLITTFFDSNYHKSKSK